MRWPSSSAGELTRRAAGSGSRRSGDDSPNVRKVVPVTDEQRWQAWCKDFDEVEREIFTLFHTRWMWRAITSLMTNGVPANHYVIVQNYFVRTYVGTVCTAVRREADLDSRTSSLARCLQALIECPHFATRARYVAEATSRRDEDGSAWTDAEITGSFDAFALLGSECVDPAVAQEALDRLASAAAPVRRYTNKVLAHRERGGDVQKLAPSFEVINRAVDELGRVLKQFYPLRYAGKGLLAVTPSAGLEWTSMFRVPWWSEGWIPPSVSDDFS